MLRTNNAAELNLFVATFIAGIAQSVQGTVTNVFGQTVPSPNVSGAGGVPGYIVNPPAQGTEAVLDRYAQMVMDSIERDGFFIRVPAGNSGPAQSDHRERLYAWCNDAPVPGSDSVAGKSGSRNPEPSGMIKLPWKRATASRTLRSIQLLPTGSMRPRAGWRPVVRLYRRNL